MGGQVGRDIAQVGLGFMERTAEHALNAQLQKKDQQEKFALSGAMQLAKNGELELLPPDIQKSLTKQIGKENFGMLQQQSQLNQALARSRAGARQEILTKKMQQMAPNAAYYGQLQQPQTQLAQQVAQQQPETLQGTQMSPVSAPQTVRRQATPEEAYQNMISMDPTGVALVTGDVAAGQLALQAQQMNFNEQKHLYNIQKNAYDRMKPEMTKTFDVQNPDGTTSKALALVMPSGQAQVVNLSQTPNKDAISRHIDRIASLNDQLDRADLSEKKRKELELRRKQTSQALEKAVDKSKSGINLFYDEEGNPILTTDPVMGRQLLALQGAMKGLDKKEIRSARKTVRNGNLALKNVDRILSMADPMTMGPLASVGNLAQNIMANVKAAPQLAQFINSTVTGVKADTNNIESEKLRKKILANFNKAPTQAHQYMLALVYQLAKLEDPDSVVREGEYDRTLKEITGGSGFTGSFANMQANLEAIKTRIQEKVAESQNFLGEAQGVIDQRMQNMMGTGQPQQPQAQEQPGTTTTITPIQRPQEADKSVGEATPEELNNLASQYGVSVSELEEFQQNAEEVAMSALRSFLEKESKKKVTSQVSNSGFQLLSQFEGQSSSLYDDATGQPITDPSEASGYPTIGIGHQLTDEEINSGTIEIDGQEIDWRQGLNEQQMEALAQQDMAQAIEAVQESVTVPLSQNQFDALVSFAFNIGSNAFKKSGAIKALNKGNIDEFLKRHGQWVKSKGKELPGLVTRRQKEAELFRSQ